jgi:hypothetical protein
MIDSKNDALVRTLKDLHHEMLGSADALTGIADSCELLSQAQRNGWIGHLEQMIVSVSHRISQAASEVESLLDEARKSELAGHGETHDR